MSEPERDALVDDFLSSPETPGLGLDGEDSPARVVAEAIVAYRCDYADGDPLRWSTIVAELFMLDWVPRKTNLPDEALELLPDAVRAWVRYAGRRKGLAHRHVEETLAAVDRFEKEFTEAIHDPSRFGPAKQLVSAISPTGSSSRIRLRWTSGSARSTNAPSRNERRSCPEAQLLSSGHANDPCLVSPTT